MNAVDIDLSERPPEQVEKRSFVYRRWFRYSIVFLLSTVVVWGPVIAYVKYVPETFRSQWSVLLPGSGLGSNINLENLGQTSTSVATPYASNSVDPKVNYKEIALSLRVRRRAAEIADIPVHKYPNPKIKLVDQTSIMHVVYDGPTAQKAFDYSSSLLEALEIELDALRKSERENILTANMAQLEEYEDKANDVQRQIIEFQSKWHMISSDQFQTVLERSAELAHSREDALVKKAGIEGRIGALSKALALGSSEAASVLSLQQDQQLQIDLATYFELSTELKRNSSVLGSEHPKVRLVRSQVSAAIAAVRDRAALLLPEADLAFIERYMSNQDNGEVNFFQQLVSLQVDLMSVEEEIRYLDELLRISQSKVGESARLAAELKELEHNLQVAETIFLSTLAKLDLGRSDIFATYPMIQVLVEPTMPAGPEKLQRVFALVGASMGSVLICLSLGLLWKRRELLLKLSKRK